MTAIATPSNQAIPPTKKEHGFSVSQGANWSEYLAFRPIYPTSFFARIYAYHARKPGSTWQHAHDIGAGCGIVSSSLATRFDLVTVSDPNDGYVTLAHKMLVEQSGIPASRFRFEQEGAETSSVDTGSVDLVAACECIHWTDPEGAIKEFARELRSGGTLAVTHYTAPRFVGNERAQRVWDGLWARYSERAQGETMDHAFRIVNSGLESVRLPEEDWTGVRRTYINCEGSLKAFAMNDRIGESKVLKGEERIFEEGDPGWADEKDIKWLKGYFATWVPKIPEEDLKDLWDGLETALDGKKAKIETPLVMILATKR